MANQNDSEQQAWLETILHAVLGDDMPDETPDDIGGQSISELFEIDRLEQEIGVREGFFERLLEEDDWSFVIRRMVDTDSDPWWTPIPTDAGQ